MIIIKIILLVIQLMLLMIQIIFDKQELMPIVVSLGLMQVFIPSGY